MSFEANVYQIMIASPSDVIRERNIAKEIVYNWNIINALDKGIVLLPISWETHSAPKMGNRPQEIINKQILEKSDLLIGIFWTRLGTPTSEAISGTVEEIEKHISSGKTAMLYFSDIPVVPGSIDQHQYNALLKFKKECLDRGLVEKYESINDFQDKLSRQLGIIINTEDYFQSKFPSTGLLLGETDIVNELSIINELSDEAKELLIETSKDKYGELLRIHDMQGITLQTNRKRLNKDNSPRTTAIWEDALDQLIYNDLIKEKGTKGEIFALTNKGYKLADFLIKKIH